MIYNRKMKNCINPRNEIKKGCRESFILAAFFSGLNDDIYY